MIVKVLLFAAARELVGRGEIEMELEQGTRVAELRSYLEDSYPEMKKLLASSNWSVNGRYVKHDHVLTEGCEVGLIVPVSGG